MIPASPKTLLPVAAALLLAACGNNTEQGNPDPLPDLQQGLKVATWNLETFPGKSQGDAPVEDQQKHLAKVADVLKKLDPDILCLQEVKDPAALGRLIKDALPDHSLQVICKFKGTQEVAILSRHQAQQAFMEEFVKAEATPPRGFAFASFLIGGEAIAV